MKAPYFCWLVLFLFFSSCGLTRERAGYYPLDQNIGSDCEVLVSTLANTNELDLKELGRLELGEAPFLEYPGFCKKEDALAIIREEACHAKANYANIVLEGYPTFMQSCYHCTVVFYKVPASKMQRVQELVDQTKGAEPEPDPEYAWVVVGKLVKAAAVAGAVIGVSFLINLTRP